MEHLRDEPRHVAAVERRLTREELVEDDAERPEVRARVDILRRPDLLRDM